MKEIGLTQNKVALVDDWEYEQLNKHKWFALLKGNTYYARRRISRYKLCYMHHLVLPLIPGFEIDHIDGSGLNNQKHNLRYSTSQQNKMNQRSQLNTSSKYKGVHWCKETNKWRARIKLKETNKNLGFFRSEKEAALAYNSAALQYFGEFARLNVVNSPINREELLEKLIKMEGEEDGKPTTTE